MDWHRSLIQYGRNDKLVRERLFLEILQYRFYWLISILPDTFLKSVLKTFFLLE